MKRKSVSPQRLGAFVLPLPSKVVTLAEMKDASQLACQCAETIRKWLPVTGRPMVGSIQNQEQWHNKACRLCFDFFSLYSPDQLCYASQGTAEENSLWAELRSGMIEIREHYKWHEVDFDEVFPGVIPNQRLEQISDDVLERVFASSNAILAVNESEGLAKLDSVAAAKKRKRGGQSNPDRDRAFAQEYSDGLNAGLWDSVAGFAKAKGKLKPNTARAIIKRGELLNCGELNQRPVTLSRSSK